tara:strand:- start:5575 stop:6327 length:753 start_codon:yes stop_codon:yes gene_type:complete
MIKFFRKIRQKMLNENKFSKYLLYAIGEIVLVVIGILIALGISNWNDNRKNNAETNDFIGRLTEEIEINIDNVDLAIELQSKHIAASKSILDMFHKDKKNINPESFDSLMIIIYQSASVEINNGTFSEGLNTGKIGSIPSDKLRSALYSLISIISDTRRLEQINTNDLNGPFTQFLYPNYNYRKMDDKFSEYKGKIGETKFKNFDNLTLLNNMEFENYMDNRFFNNSVQLEQYEKLKTELLRLNKLLQNE